jgi:hypothetical protein
MFMPTIDEQMCAALMRRLRMGRRKVTMEGFLEALQVGTGRNWRQHLGRIVQKQKQYTQMYKSMEKSAEKQPTETMRKSLGNTM